MRRARYSAVILLLLSAGCAQNKKPETQPAPVATTPETTKAIPAPATTKAAPAQATKKAPANKAPAARAAGSTTTAKPAPATTAKTTPVKPASPRPTATAHTLDLEALKTQLKQTKAIGLMTKLTLKNQVDDLLDKFRKHHAGRPTPTTAELRRSYDMLMMKVLSLLQDHDQKLASDIVYSRERIWGLLVDPKAFAALQA